MKYFFAFCDLFLMSYFAAVFLCRFCSVTVIAYFALFASAFLCFASYFFLVKTRINTSAIPRTQTEVRMIHVLSPVLGAFASGTSSSRIVSVLDKRVALFALGGSSSLIVVVVFPGLVVVLPPVVVVSSSSLSSPP